MAVTEYFRTAKGTHRHASYSCANAHRAIRSGDPVRIADQDVSDWAPCEFCCTAEETAEFTAPVPPVMCRNSGVVNPRRMRSTCTDCGKEGAVNRSTGSLRAHQ
jgi:hypothetical protein